MYGIPLFNGRCKLGGARNTVDCIPNYLMFILSYQHIQPYKLRWSTVIDNDLKMELLLVSE
jgi:hypothetical protein